MGSGRDERVERGAGAVGDGSAAGKCKGPNVVGETGLKQGERMKGTTGGSVFSRGNQAFMNMYSYKLRSLPSAVRDL